ncbi:MAG: DUF4838 domain-containing protein [Lentisphaeria bacterium]|nr:DUF4838 domain-containing protein [Lentisphaeria bacterium]
MGRIFSILTLLVCCFVTVHGVELVKDGKFTFSGVVVAANAVPSTRLAAEEIVYHLEKVTGEKLPVIAPNAVAAGKKYIFVGHCKKTLHLKAWTLARNNGIIEITDKAIFISGRDRHSHPGTDAYSRGTLFAAYEFLEKFVGVRWIWPGKSGEVIPRHRNLNIPEQKLITKSHLLSSGWRTAGVAYKEAWKNSANRERFFEDQKVWLRRHRFASYSNFYHGHAFLDYYNKYHKSKPEFFNMLPDGTRSLSPFGWNGGVPKYVSMCVTNPELVKVIVDKWSKGNRARMLNLNENDTSGKCVCDNCLTADNSPRSNAERRADAKKLFDAGLAQKKAKQKVSRENNAWQVALGSLSDRYCQFYLAAQKEADKIDPKHLIMGLIYANYSEPPTDKIKLNERIILRFCPPFMYPWTDEKVADYKRIWSGWSKTGARLMFRPNFTHDGHHFPVQYHEVFYDLYTFSAKNGMIAVDMDTLTGHYGTQGLVNFVIASLNHNVNVPLATLEDEFYSAFGPAKKHIKEYFDYVTKVSMKSGFKDPFKEKHTNEGGLLWVDLFRVADRMFTPEVMAKCKSILAAAAATPGLAPVEKERIQILQYGLENARLTMATEAAHRKYKAGGKFSDFNEAVIKLDAYRASVEHTNALNLGHIWRLEYRHWRRLPLTRYKNVKKK